MLSTEHRPKIAFIVPDFAGGGAQKMLINMANEFSRRHYDVDLLVINGDGPLSSNAISGVKVINFKRSRAIRSFFDLWAYIFFQKPAVILSAMTHINIMSVWAGRLSFRKTNIIISERSYFSLSSKRGRISPQLMASLVFISYPLANKIVGISHGVSRDISKYIHKNFHLKIRTIYNPVVTSDMIRDSQKHIDAPPSKAFSVPLLVTIGRLVPAKDQKTLLAAFAILRRNRSIKLVIIGEGELLPELMGRAQELGIQDDVEFTGFLKNTSHYMANASVFVISSIWEGFCNVLVEALLYGLPIVSTDCKSGPGEILKNGEYGMLVPIKDAQAMADAISTLIDSPPHPRIQRDRAMDFTTEKICNEFEALIK